MYSRNDLIDLAAKKLNVTEEQKREMINSGSHRYLGRGGWGLTFLKQAGLICSPKEVCFKLLKQGYIF